MTRHPHFYEAAAGISSDSSWGLSSANRFCERHRRCAQKGPEPAGSKSSGALLLEDVAKRLKLLEELTVRPVIIAAPLGCPFESNRVDCRHHGSRADISLDLQRPSLLLLFDPSGRVCRLSGRPLDEALVFSNI